MAEIIEVPVYKFDSELEKIIRQSNTFEKRFKQYDFQNLDWNDGEVTAAESGIIVGGIAIVFLLIILLIRGSVINQKSRRAREAYVAKFKSVEQEKIKQETIKGYEKLAKEAEEDPDQNIWDNNYFDMRKVHFARLEKYGRSMFNGETYYIGSRGGIYTVSANGTRNYKY